MKYESLRGNKNFLDFCEEDNLYSLNPNKDVIIKNKSRRNNDRRQNAKSHSLVRFISAYDNQDFEHHLR